MWRVVINRNVDVGIAIATLFESDYSREAVAALEAVADGVGTRTASQDNVVVHDIAEVAGEGDELRFIETKAETAEFDICKAELAARAVFTVVPIVTRVRIGLKCTQICFRGGRETKLKARLHVIGIAFQLRKTLGVDVIAPFNVITKIAVNAQAGFRTWDVEIARTVCIAYTDIFNGFWLWCNDHISGLCCRRERKYCSRSAEKFFNPHKITP